MEKPISLQREISIEVLGKNKVRKKYSNVE
jgi:hypothetical protein